MKRTGANRPLPSRTAGRAIIQDKLDDAQAIAARIEEVIGKDKLTQLLDILEDFQKL